MFKKINNKKSLYIFHNDEYGYEYVKKTIDLCKQHKDIEPFFVLSSKNHTTSHILREKIKKFFNFHNPHIKTIFLIKKNKFKYRIVHNINQKYFTKNIPKDSVGIICGFNQIFKKRTMEKFKLLINFHPSLLPAYRGPTPSSWVIKNNEDITGITVHKVTKEIDCGEILFNKTLKIETKDTPEKLDHKISIMGSKILSYHFLDIVRGEITKKLKYTTNNIKESYYGFFKQTND